MNTYDAALPKGTEPAEGHTPRPRTAAPGSGLDAVYASRYTRLEGDIAEGLSLDVSFDSSDDGPILTDAEARRLAAAVADETPPEARRVAAQEPYNPED